MIFSAAEVEGAAGALHRLTGLERGAGGLGEGIADRRQGDAGAPVGLPDRTAIVIAAEPDDEIGEAWRETRTTMAVLFVMCAGAIVLADRDVVARASGVFRSAAGSSSEPMRGKATQGAKI